MTSNEFLLIISWLFNVLFTALAFVFNIPLTNNIKFGPVCVIFLVFMIFLYLMFKPFSKK